MAANRQYQSSTGLRTVKEDPAFSTEGKTRNLRANLPPGGTLKPKLTEPRMVQKRPRLIETQELTSSNTKQPSKFVKTRNAQYNPRRAQSFAGANTFLASEVRASRPVMQQ
jgi:hypothetical protein